MFFVFRMPRLYKAEDLAQKYTTPAQKATRIKKLRDMIDRLQDKKRKLDILIYSHYKEIGIHTGKEEGVKWNPENRRYE
jgi:hypothetical protein